VTAAFSGVIGERALSFVQAFLNTAEGTMGDPEEFIPYPDGFQLTGVDPIVDSLHGHAKIIGCFFKPNKFW
jgi:hypothetical protein